MNCIKCKQEHNTYHFRVLRVETLHVRDVGKNSRVQALGGIFICVHFSVCFVLREKLRRQKNTGKEKLFLLTKGFFTGRTIV